MRHKLTADRLQELREGHKTGGVVFCESCCIPFNGDALVPVEVHIKGHILTEAMCNGCADEILEAYGVKEGDTE